MDKNFTSKNRLLILVTVLLCLFLLSIRIQAEPTLKFAHPAFPEINKQVNATDIFPTIIPGMDALVTIELMANCATFLNIDDSTAGYHDARGAIEGGSWFWLIRY